MKTLVKSVEFLSVFGFLAVLTLLGHLVWWGLLGGMGIYLLVNLVGWASRTIGGETPPDDDERTIGGETPPDDDEKNKFKKKRRSR